MENLNVCDRHGRTPFSFQIDATVECSIPSWSASSRLDQCVTPRLDGGEASVNYATELAAVEFDPGVVEPSRLLAAVESAGYEASMPATPG